MTINIKNEFNKHFITTTSVGEDIFKKIMDSPESKNDLIELTLDFKDVLTFTSVPFNTLKGLIESMDSKQHIKIELINANESIKDSYKFVYEVK